MGDGGRSDDYGTLYKIVIMSKNKSKNAKREIIRIGL